MLGTSRAAACVDNLENSVVRAFWFFLLSIRKKGSKLNYLSKNHQAKRWPEPGPEPRSIWLQNRYSFPCRINIQAESFFFFPLGPHPWHMEVPRKLNWLLAYTTAHDNAGSLTHWARPRIEPDSSWILVEPQWELLTKESFKSRLDTTSTLFAVTLTFFIN